MVETITEQIVGSSGNPWWLTAITGSSGALVVLMMWVRALSASNKVKEIELKEVTKDSITCITKILERLDRDQAWKDKLEELIEKNHQEILIMKQHKVIYKPTKKDMEGKCDD